ncbi:MAG: hypothetical protein II175_05150, partial [Schwartzia sp.]|nr:hypothetical protein [Schwartzia sp. (in: firmicutes)]
QIEQENVLGLLKKSAECKADFPIAALRKGLLSAEQIASVSENPKGEEFLRNAGKNGLLNAVQMDELRSLVPDEDLNFAQVLYDEKAVTLEKLESLFSAYDKYGESPVREIVRNRAVAVGLDAEADRYSSFAELFVHSFKRFMDTPVVVNSKEVLVEAASLSHMVSQKLVGGVTMVTGIQAENGVFLEMARRYSHEDIKEVDALAVDCLCEFLNVVNGLFAVDISSENVEVDLDMPRVQENSVPEANFQIVLAIDTSFGEFSLVMAGDEFVLR